MHQAHPLRSYRPVSQRQIGYRMLGARSVKKIRWVHDPVFAPSSRHRRFIAQLAKLAHRLNFTHLRLYRHAKNADFAL